jgi:hypothetical protein
VHVVRRPAVNLCHVIDFSKEIYRDRRENWIDDELVETQHELDQASSRYDVATKLCIHKIDPQSSVL